VNIVMDDPPGSPSQSWLEARESAQRSERWLAEVRALESARWLAAQVDLYTIG
jgi:hypothetical protein